MPFQVVEVPSTGATLPQLSSSATAGNYGAIVVLSEVSYQYPNGFFSALTTEQWNALYAYQTAFGVRMVRLDVYPGPDFGTTTAIAGAGCCGAGVEQLISISNTAAFPTAGLKVGATMSTIGLWHYPATITNTTSTTQFAKFGPGGSYSTDTTAGVINNFGNRQQMVFFISWATAWNPTSNYLQHAWIHWVTRGLYVGFRRLYLSTQVDDVFLSTPLYRPQGTEFRLRTGDLANHVTWTTQINAKMPAGSNYFIELAHNGNGDIEVAAATSQGQTTCNPNMAITYDEQTATPLEFQKPLGTGSNIWPTTPTSYTWSLTCAKLDTLMQWFSTAANRNAFAHVSHTFTHMSMNNATYADVAKEISFNKAWMQQVGFSAATRFSGSGLVPPAITGTRNGDAIKAWMDNGIRHIVGDNTRPLLMNPQSSFWPLTSTVANNGYAGLNIIPRWATTIYYNCDTPDCTLQEWIDTSGGSGDFQNLLRDARAVNTRHLLGLHWDPFMFHQANMRQTDMPNTVVNGVSAKLSLLQIWVEVIVQEMVRLTSWPIISLKHDDIGTTFQKREIRDKCNPNLVYNYSADGMSIVSVTVNTNGNTCGTPIPVTFPGPVTSTTGATQEKVGGDPLTLWVTMSGAARTYTLTTPIAV
ncbi:hypothetical protein H2201_001415 [Coniosporium apollinis]|uniref:Extracellular serine-rich protein n=2 Tax=Coniosporium TaxID=2810619 RepID=A0ABQ9P1Y4_9PEZI|nr:hypothetical protein H2199_002505 [Cladosporium sp. JES 115]KAJ9668367.1 hypothetical protein H2201_001415 [Coniosporium apollinis]